MIGNGEIAVIILLRSKDRPGFLGTAKFMEIP